VGKTNIARVFFFQPGQEIIVTNGYVKKRQKLDQDELQRAQRHTALLNELEPPIAPPVSLRQATIRVKPNANRCKDNWEGRHG